MSILLRDGLYNQPIDLVLEDLLVRFVINVPDEDLSSIERVFFQVEEAQWFYTDFVRALNLSLPSMKMKTFAPKILNKCPLLWKWGDPRDALARFGAYKSTIPVRGVAMLNKNLTKVVLVRGYESKSWSFPRGKISKDESDLECAIREVREETGFDCRAHVNEADVLERTICGKNFRIYLARNVPEDTKFEPLVRNEIAEITWFDIKGLQKAVKNNSTKYFVVNILLKPLTRWIDRNKGLVSEKELIHQAEVRLKALMGISAKPDANLDAGRELLNILQGAKPQVGQDVSQHPQQFQMSLPQHLHSVYAGTGQMPQFFPPFSQNPGMMMPPPEFRPPYFAPPPVVNEVPQTSETKQGLLNSKELLSILNGPRKERKEKSEQVPLPVAESVSRPDTPSKKITLLKRENNTDASNTLLGLLGKKPPSENTKEKSNAAELLGILNGKKPEKNGTHSSAPGTSDLIQLHESNTPHPLKDDKASGELLSILNNPKTIKLAKKESPDLSSTEHNPADLSAGNQILQFINLGSQKSPQAEEAPSQNAHNDDEFEDFEDFDDLEEPSAPQNQIYDRIRHTFDLESEDEDLQEQVERNGSNGTNSAGAGLLQLLNGGKPPLSTKASYGETYGAPQVASVPQPTYTPSSNGADLLRLLKRG